MGAALVVEREHLLPLAAEGMDLAQRKFSTVKTGLREGFDQRLLGAVKSRDAGTSEDLCQQRGTLA